MLRYNSYLGDLEDLEHYSKNLCKLERSCKFFRLPNSECYGLSLVEKAAVDALLRMTLPGIPGTHPHSSVFNTWKETHNLTNSGSMKQHLYELAFSDNWPQDIEEAAKKEIKRRYGCLDQKLAENAKPCVSGDAMVTMANGSQRKVSCVKEGDAVKTETGEAIIAKIFWYRPPENRPLVQLSNELKITRCHPVKWHGRWVHPTEIASPVSITVPALYNFELAHPVSFSEFGLDHTMWIDGILCATLGMDVGTRLINARPDLDIKWGRGYWNRVECRNVC